MLVAKRLSFFLDGLGLDSRSRGGLLRRGLGSGPGWVAGVTPYATVGLFFTKNHWRGFCIKKLMKYNRTKFFLHLYHKTDDPQIKVNLLLPKLSENPALH